MRATRRQLLFGASAIFSGCALQPARDDHDGDAGRQADLRAYDELTLALEAHRSQVLGEEADQLEAAGRRLYWLEYPTIHPVLHSRAPGGSEVVYDFGVGAEGADYRASSELVATVEEAGENLIYRAFAADEPHGQRDELVLPAPKNARHWAFVVRGSEVYFMRDEAETVLWRWIPGLEPAPIFTLEAAGIEVGLFTSFGIEGNSLLVVESGRLWHVDLPSAAARWLRNETAITGAVSFEGDRVVYAAADGTYLYDLTSDVRDNLAARIEASGYRLNETFAAAHHFASSARLSAARVVYLGQDGLFVFNPKNDGVRPILLHPRVGFTSSVRVHYSDPQPLDTRLVYVTGLESVSGSVGADGPVYEVPF